jgi:cytochrome P450
MDRAECPFSRASRETAPAIAPADPLALDADRSPYAAYAALRDRPGLTWRPHAGGGGMWLVTRYDEVATLLRSPHISKRPCPAPPVTAPASPFDDNMLAKDGADHARLRRFVNRAFTSEQVAAVEQRVRELTHSLLSAAKREGRLDFMRDVASWLPAVVIAEMLGVPPEDREQFRAWSNDILTGNDATAPSGPRQRAAAGALATYFARLIQRRQRRGSGQDLLGALLERCDVDGSLTVAELIALCMLLLVAGHETTVNLFGNGMLLLMTHPEQCTLLRERPELMKSAVEEMLRFESPVQRATFRAATADLVLGGVTVRRGDQLSAVLGAANRDPAQFPDAHRFDVTRQPNRHLAFGLGAHFCIGPALSRLEAVVAFEIILDTFPNLRLAQSQADWNADATAVRGLRTLHLMT